MLGQRVRDHLSLLRPSPAVGADSDRDASSLLFRLEQKKQERSEEAVNSIDFSHSSRKAWSTINKLTGRSERSSLLCLLSANSIVSQLVNNGAHMTGGRQSTRLINRLLSDLWKVPTPEGYSISDQNRRQQVVNRRLYVFVCVRGYVRGG